VLNDTATRLGASQQTAFSSNDMRTSADDLAMLLAKIYRGEVFNEANRARLLDDMKTQVYRQGIPAGIPDATVADKVGFLDGMLHDAAIVYGEKGDYILVIMTDGLSWAYIAELAGWVDGQMYITD
jgi:beta-lactamase class A